MIFGHSRFVGPRPLLTMPKALAKLYADDVEFGSPGMGGWHESKGRASLEKNMGDFFTAFPDAKVTSFEKLAKTEAPKPT